MVALQILVLTVGVRILLGELRLNRNRFSFFLRARQLASSFTGFLRSKKCELFSEQGKYLEK